MLIRLITAPLKFAIRIISMAVGSLLVVLTLKRIQGRPVQIDIDCCGWRVKIARLDQENQQEIDGQ